MLNDKMHKHEPMQLAIIGVMCIFLFGSESMPPPYIMDFLGKFEWHQTSYIKKYDI
jgi:hypothetical protein